MTNLLTWDIDGTLSDDRHRAHHYRAGRHEKYFSYDAMVSDPPYERARALYDELLGYGWEMAYLTARLERNRPATVDWLKMHGFANPGQVVLRPEEFAEIRPPEFKAGVFRSLVESGCYEKIMHIDNDPEVISRFTEDFGPNAAFLADWDQNPDTASIVAPYLSPVVP